MSSALILFFLPFFFPPHWYCFSFLFPLTFYSSIHFVRLFSFLLLHSYFFFTCKCLLFFSSLISKFFLLHFILETFIIQSNAPSKDTFISHSDPESFKFSIKCQYIFCISPDDYSISLSLLKCKAR